MNMGYTYYFQGNFKKNGKICLSKTFKKINDEYYALLDSKHIYVCVCV